MFWPKDKFNNTFGFLFKHYNAVKIGFLDKSNRRFCIEGLIFFLDAFQPRLTQLRLAFLAVSQTEVGVAICYSYRYAFERNVVAEKRRKYIPRGSSARIPVKGGIQNDRIF